SGGPGAARRGRRRDQPRTIARLQPVPGAESPDGRAMNGRRLFGVETEYAVSAVRRDGTMWATPSFNEELLRRARRRLIHLPGTSDCGLFLSNGSRLYVDYGDHPEIGSPECLDPWDAVRYSKAGDRIMVQLADDVQRDHPEIAEILIRKGNVDYSGQLTT